MDQDEQPEFDGPRDGESLIEFEFRFLEWSKKNKDQRQTDEEQSIRDNAFKYVLNPGSLRRALLRIIAEEDFDYEFVIKEQSPFGYIFGTSLDERIASRRQAKENRDVQEAAEVAVQALAYEYLYHARIDVEQAMEKCQSPIEAILLGALIAVCAKKNLTLQLDTGLLRWPCGMIHRSHNSSAAINIKPQAEVGEYKVDFLLKYQHVSTDYPSVALERISSISQLVVRPDLATHEKHRKQLIVECDGHEFHEKTKEQAAKDKSRDRYLQKLGYKVFRFSGSEINRDAISCAYEIFEGFNIDTGSKEQVKPPKGRQ